jgi:methyltransferase (TIGR00027 family)
VRRLSFDKRATFGRPFLLSQDSEAAHLPRARCKFAAYLKSAITMPIEHVSDTARWVAVYRAMESKRSDALFHDPFAERLAGEKGAQIVTELKRGRSMAWPMIVRTAVFDEMIMDRVQNFGVDTVINLAAGLDTRAWRLPLPPALRWYDVDLPAITAYKANEMREHQPVCNYEAISVDLTDSSARNEVLARIGSTATTALVVSEGLLIYLTADQVASLARDIRAIPTARWWMFDIANPALLRIMNRTWGKAVGAGAAPFQFAPAEGTDFFAPQGWREIEFRSGIEESRRLNRQMRTMPIWRFLNRFAPAHKQEEFRRMSAYVMLERTD